MKAVEQYIHVVLFIELYKVDPTFESVGVTIQMKTTVTQSVPSSGAVLSTVQP